MIRSNPRERGSPGDFLMNSSNRNWKRCRLPTASVMLTKRLLDAKEAANYLSISRSKLYQWANRERIRSVRIDTRRLFDVNDLDEFIDSLKAEQGKK